MKIISKSTKKEKFLSYCTTCMNRLWQLKQTLPYNLSLLDDDEEICLVNYNSQDGLDEWIKDNFMDYINKGKLVYFYTKEPEYFHASKSKNLSHFLSNSKYVFNLDGDNFIAKETRKFIKTLEEDFVIHEHNGKDDGTPGRICMKKNNFISCGGYDESFLPMTYSDIDLIERVCKLKNIKKINPIITSIYKILSPIQNTRSDKIKNTDWKKSFLKMHFSNKKRSINNIKSGILIVNKSREKVKGILNYDKDIIL